MSSPWPQAGKEMMTIKRKEIMDFILPTKITKRRKWLPGKKKEKWKGRKVEMRKNIRANSWNSWH